MVFEFLAICIYIFTYLLIYLFTYILIYLLTYLLTYILTDRPTDLPIYRPTDRSTYLSYINSCLLCRFLRFPDCLFCLFEYICHGPRPQYIINSFSVGADFRRQNLTQTIRRLNLSPHWKSWSLTSESLQRHSVKIIDMYYNSKVGASSETTLSRHGQKQVDEHGRSCRYLEY